MPQVKLILIVAALLLGWVVVKPRDGARGPEGQGGRAVGLERSTKQGGEVGDTKQGGQRTTYLALGDSYTIGESVDVTERYPVQVGRMLAETGHMLYSDPEIIAVTGWTTGNLLEALSAAKPTPTYQIVSLLIGVNNQYQGRSQAEYREQFGLLLQKCIWLAGSRPSHVVVLSIPDYSVTPFARLRDTALIAAQVDSFNRINSALAKEYMVNYVDVTGESRKAVGDATLIAADGLHFSGKEYEIWARLAEPVFKVMLQ